jgi:hypothetical protein
MRLAIPFGVLLAFLLAAPAHATMVYVKGEGTQRPVVYVAGDDGSQPRRIGVGTMPTISPNGRWVAWVSAEPLERVLLRRADRSRATRRIARASSVTDLRFSPDSTKLGMVLTRRLAVHDIAARTTDEAVAGFVRGYSFSPDSGSIVYGSSGSSDAADAESDLYIVEPGDGPRQRVTRDRKSLNPLWGPDGIIHDRQKVRPGMAPSYNLFEVQPDGGSLRRITALRIPNLLSGLVPIELSADGTRLLAEFVGQDTGVGFAVDPRTGNTRSLSRDSETGFVGFDLSGDGRTVLGQTGGPDPAARHNVATMPYRGGKPTVLVRRAAFPDWTL